MVDNLNGGKLELWRGNNPNLTDHGRMHCERILQILDKLIPPEFSKDLSCTSLYLLCSAVWLHDLGMGFNAKDGKKLTPAEVRQYHHELAKTFIKDRWQTLSLPSDKHADALGLIVFAHRKSIPIDSNEYNSRIIGPDEVSIRELAALLRFADALDTDYRRAQWFDQQYRIESDSEARKHHLACYCIGGLRFELAKKTITIEAVSHNMYEKFVTLWKFVTDLISEFETVRTTLIDHGILWNHLDLNIDGKIYGEFAAKEEYGEIKGNRRHHSANIAYALSNEKRLKILEYLSNLGTGLSLTDLADKLKMTTPAVLKHLKVLEEVGLLVKIAGPRPAWKTIGSSRVKEILSCFEEEIMKRIEAGKLFSKVQMKALIFDALDERERQEFKSDLVHLEHTEVYHLLTEAEKKKIQGWATFF